MTLDISQEVKDAASRIGPYIHKTPLYFSYRLSKKYEAEIYLKLENQQVTGSFKARGALNKILMIAEDDRRKVVTASTGNHAAAVCYALERTGREGVIFLPETVSKIKTENLKQYNHVELKFFGQDSVDAEIQARKSAAEENYIFVSPYNDAEIIAGQGTIALEILDQLLSPPDAIFVPVGGGGLISGIASVIHHNSEAAIIGCQPANSAVMHASVNAGRVLDLESKPTVSDGTAGGVEQDSITFEFCRKLVDEWVEVSEDEILHSMKRIIVGEHLMIEGAAGLALAALTKKLPQFKGKRVVLVLCGNKISEELLVKVVNS